MYRCSAKTLITIDTFIFRLRERVECSHEIYQNKTITLHSIYFRWLQYHLYVLAFRAKDEIVFVLFTSYFGTQFYERKYSVIFVVRFPVL